MPIPSAMATAICAATGAPFETTLPIATERPARREPEPPPPPPLPVDRVDLSHEARAALATLPRPPRIEPVSEPPKPIHVVA